MGSVSVLYGTSCLTDDYPPDACYHLSTMPQGSSTKFLPVSPRSFRLINMRQSFGFKLIKNGFKEPVVVAATRPVPNLTPDFPTGGHLMVTSDPK